MVKDTALQAVYSGSLGGLIALAEGAADMAGCHLWDEESDTYNTPFVRRLLPGRSFVVATLAHRNLGLIVAAGNPKSIHTLADLAKPGVRFVNRQPGSGTRVWLDAMLRRMEVDPRRVAGYTDERLTHTDVARAVAEGTADAGLGLQTAALAYRLDFAALNRERYDLVMLAETAAREDVQALFQWLVSAEGRHTIDALGGYDSAESGVIQR